MELAQDLHEVLYVVGGIIVLVAFVQIMIRIRKKKARDRARFTR